MRVCRNGVYGLIASVLALNCTAQAAVRNEYTTVGVWQTKYLGSSDYGPVCFSLAPSESGGVSIGFNKKSGYIMFGYAGLMDAASYMDLSVDGIRIAHLKVMNETYNLDQKRATLVSVFDPSLRQILRKGNLLTIIAGEMHGSVNLAGYDKVIDTLAWCRSDHGI